jgi:phosphatidylglycerophosphate synthase
MLESQQNPAWAEMLAKIDAKRKGNSSFGNELVSSPTSDMTIRKAMAKPSAPDIITVTSYALGFWWALGGPHWAGIASIVGDELDGRLARATYTCSERGSALDWGADVALTPLALMRLGRTVGYEKGALLAAPPLLYMQASMKAKGMRPTVGSARAVVMLSAMFADKVKSSL